MSFSPVSLHSSTPGESASFRDSPRRLHVLTLTPFYPFQGDETAGCFIAEPLKWLDRAGITNSVMAVRPIYRGRIRPETTIPPAHWAYYLAPPGGTGLAISGAFLYSRLLPQIRRLHAQHPIDLIHAHAALPCGHSAALVAGEIGIPYVVTVHGLDAFSTVQVKGMAGNWCRRISTKVFRDAKRVICVSERVREQVESGTREVQSEVVYNGVDSVEFAPSETKEETSTLTMLSVGNLIPSKGHELLLRAMGELHARYPTLRYQIIGVGIEQVRLAKLATTLGISDRVVFRGKRSRREVSDAMKDCTFFALSSYYEALGCVYLEAMACEKPVIACREQGIAEIIRSGENGLLVGENDLEDTVRAISMLLEDSALRRTLGILARRTICNRFTLEHQAARLARVYRESLA